MKNINNRYLVDRLAYKNQTGEVFECRDTLNNSKRIMMKVYTIEFSSGRSVDTIAEHISLMKNVNHPNLTSIYEFDLVQQIDGKSVGRIQYFYTFEFFDEDTYVEYINLSRDEIRDAIGQILKALRYLHFRGICYKYLNFDNLIFYRSESGIQVKLKNLVFMNYYNETININSNMVTTFTAPEVIWENQSLPSSDVFSFGVVLYYLYFSVDYKLRQFTEIYNDHNENEIINLVKKMTNTYAGDRYNSIESVMSEVDRILRLKLIWDDYAAYNKIHDQMPIIAREREIRSLLDLSAHKLNHKSGINGAVIIGEAGMGKTRLSQEVAYRLKLEGHRIFSHSCHSNEPFILFKEIIRQIFKTEKVGFDLVQKYGSELVKLIPEIAHKWKINQSEILPAHMESLKIANRVYNFISDFTELEPIVMFIEDLNEIGTYDLVILDYLMRNDNNTSLFIVATSTENVMQNQCVSHWIDTNVVRRYNLSGFTYEDAGYFISGILGINGKPLNFVTHLMKHSNGIPGKMFDMVNNLFHSKRLHISNDKNWNVDEITFEDVSPIGKEENDYLEEIVKRLESTLVSILEIMSIFEEAISCETLSEFLDIDHKSTHTMLYRLIEEKLIEEKFGDWGYTYNFTNRRFKVVMGERIDVERLIDYHKKASEIFEIEVLTNKKKFSDALIYHLSHSKQYEKAAHYCLLAAEQMKSFNIDSQVILYVEKADLIYQQMGSALKRSETLMQIGDLLRKNGRYEEAIEKYDLGQKLALEAGLEKAIVDHKNRIAAIFLLTNRVNEAETILGNNLEEAMRLNHKEGRIVAMRVLIEIYLMRKQLEGTRELIESHLEIARELKNEALVGVFLYLLGHYYYILNEPYEALHQYEMAKAVQENIPNCCEIIYTFNGMGLVYSEVLGLYDKAKSYFKMGIRSIEATNFVEGKHFSYLYLAQTHLLQDQYQEAFVNVTKSIEICETTGNRFALFSGYVTLCRLYLCRNEYDKAYATIKKAELEYRKNKFWASQTVQYFYAYINYYIETRNFDRAEPYLSELNESTFLKGNQESREFELLRFIVEHNKDNYLLYNKKIDYSFLETRVRSVKSISETKLLRCMILSLAISFTHYQKFIDVQKLLNLDDQLINVFNSDAMSARRSVVEGILSNDRVTYYNKILNHYEAVLFPEEIWFVYKQLGDEYMYTGNLYMASNAYFSAFDTVRNLTFKLNHALRDNYIIFDEGKIDLKKKMNSVLLKVLEGKVDAERLHFKGIEYNSIEEYFDIGPVKYLYEDRRFLDSVFHHYANRYRTKYETINDLAVNLGNDDRNNIMIILQYCIQKMVAERGYLYILDENSKSIEVMKSDPNAKVPEIQHIIKNAESAERGLIVSALHDMGNRHLLSKYQKGIVFMPVRRIKPEYTDQLRRKSDAQDGKNAVLAYLYLESSMVLNNFNYDSLEELHSALNLLHVLLDNYNLKRISTNDRLTGVYLRKYIEEIFPVELSRARAENLKLSVIMCDIDKFKNINDMFGHRKGDEILTAIGRILKNTLRKSDYVGRYGGEEFIILLPETNHEDAFLISEKLRMSIEELMLLGENRPVTMSFGVSEYPGHGLNEEELVERADQGLYYSKNTGRNRTTVWNESIGQAYYRFDRLAGILTGNISSDTRTVQAIIDTLDLFKLAYNSDEKMSHVLKTLIDITESQTAAVYALMDQKMTLKYVQERGVQGFSSQFEFDENLINHYAHKESGHYFINWEDNSTLDSITNIPIWKSCIILPLFDSNGIKGVLVLTVPISVKEFDFNAYNYVNAYSGILASLL